MTDVAFEVIDGQEASYYRKEKESDTIDGHVTKVPYVIDETLSASSINEYNVVLTVVDTEYSQLLPANCKGIEFVSRGGYPTRYAFTTGKVAGLVSPYFILKSNCSYENPATLNLSSKTIYFASDNAGDVIELIAWS